jgi:hypothetical protein
VRRFEFSYASWMRPLAMVTGIGPKWSRIEVDDHTVTVKMGWAFRATIARSAVVRAEPYTGKVWAWGVHGWRGRWLVNGSSDGLVSIEIDPPQPARCLGFKVRLRDLMVSVEDVPALTAAVRTDRPPTPRTANPDTPPAARPST